MKALKIPAVPIARILPFPHNGPMKRTRGKGSVFQRGRIWWISFSREGKTYRESAECTDKGTALRKLKARLRQVDTGIYGMEGERTVADLMEQVFADYELNNKRSLRDIQIRWKLHLKPVLGHWRSARITTDSLREYALWRREEGAANATINREFALLKRAFSLAGLVLRIPRLEERNVRKGFVDEGQAARLAVECAKIGLWMRALFAVLFDCGFRIGEALNLHVGQIDLTARTIRLNPGETKSGRGREAPMTSATFELIRACCAGKARQEFVFTRGDGSRVLNFRKTWTHITKAAGMPDLLVHDIRRSAARRMIARGISQHVAMAISGHRTIHVFQRYAIISHDDLRDAARKLEAGSYTIDTQFKDVSEQKPGNTLN